MMFRSVTVLEMTMWRLCSCAGLEYDLDLFNIVAVDDFNMGAMENKSLNIFNSRLIIASPATSTDLDFARIEGVVAHEYFHNWTGNRVTCRDWFQLTLKEGLTVFRDQVPMPAALFDSGHRGFAQHLFNMCAISVRRILLVQKLYVCLAGIQL